VLEVRCRLIETVGNVVHLADSIKERARTVPPGKTEKTNAIAVELDHRGGMSIVGRLSLCYRCGHEGNFGWVLRGEGWG